MWQTLLLINARPRTLIFAHNGVSAHFPRTPISKFFKTIDCERILESSARAV
jgi:hypothetical protein